MAVRLSGSMGQSRGMGILRSCTILVRYKGARLMVELDAGK